MYGNFTSQQGADPQGSRQPSPFGSAFYGAGSGLIKSGIGVYSEKFFGSNSEFQSNPYNKPEFNQSNTNCKQVQPKAMLQKPQYITTASVLVLVLILVVVPITNCISRSIRLSDKFFRLKFPLKMSRLFSNPQYYFNVNDQYVRNKLKVILLPFLHRGHWTRVAEPVGGRLSFKPPIYDINAPDLYIPFMAFATFIILAGFSLGFMGKFTPEALSMQFTRAMVGWVLQIAILKSILSTLGSNEVPFLDVASYSGYAFAGLSVTIIMKLIWGSSYFFVMPWMSLCMGIFLVKTTKRIIFTEGKNYERRSSRQHYLLLFVAVAQFPFFFLLGRIGA